VMAAEVVHPDALVELHAIAGEINEMAHRL
jgi:hypothetical protein